jgi:hypothetical protein
LYIISFVLIMILSYLHHVFLIAWLIANSLMLLSQRYRRARCDAERWPGSCHQGDAWGEAMQRAAPQQHSTTVELVYFSSKTWFFIDTRPINTAGRRLCIDQDDVQMCLGNVMCLEATLNCYTFKHSTQS